MTGKMTVLKAAHEQVAEHNVSWGGGAQNGTLSQSALLIKDLPPVSLSLSSGGAGPAPKLLG